MTNENMENDLNNLANILKINITERKIKYLRKNSYDTLLSNLAIQNICNIFNDTEFKCIKKLLEINLISKEIYEKYLTYDNIIVFI